MDEREKAKLRRNVMALPVTLEYPFDPEAKLLRSIGIKPPMFDIGANTGFYSDILEDIAGSEQLYLFEPLPHLHNYLKKRFRKAHVFELALSNQEGSRTIRVPFIDGKRFDTRATFGEHREPGQTGFEEIEVRLTTLDTLTRKLGLDSIGFMKIDVEGHEAEVLKGGIETLTRFAPLILIEIEARHHGFPIATIFSTLEDIGYKGYFINVESYSLVETGQFNCKRDQKQEHLQSRQFLRYLNNFFFVPEALEKDFISRVTAFLEEEKLSVRKRFSRRKSNGDE